MFKDIVGFEGSYQVNEFGDVLSLISNKVLKPFEKESGYLIVNLYKGGKRKHYFVHKLVATAFLENDGALTEVNHKDHNKLNNHFSNLEWCTRAYNMKEMFKFYGIKKEEHYCKCGKLISRGAVDCKECHSSKRRVVKNRPSKEEIAKLLESNSYVSVGKMFGVSDNAVRKWLK